MPNLLIIDDEESVRYSLRYAFEADGIAVQTAATAAEGLDLAGQTDPDVILLDLHLPDRSGLEVFRELHQRDPKRPVIFVTAHGTTETAIEAMKHGAFDYLVKPVDLERLTELLQRAFEAARLMRVPAVVAAEERGDRIVGASAPVQDMCKALGRIAPKDVNVLILGESGTGKELVARALYNHSPRAGKPFLAINCAAIPDQLLESELFGHEAGAFTGAQHRRIGKFEQCDGGTLFLDEIGDMAPAVQAKMLRILQDQRFERVGGNETLQTSVRILAATNQDLEKLARDGRFRMDLYYRFKEVTIRVPSLRERMGDIAELAHYFLFRYNRELGLGLRSFAPKALELLQAYPWPGNVRELQSVIKQAMVHATGQVLLPEFLPAEIVQACPAADPPAAPVAADLRGWLDPLIQTAQGDLYARAVEALERVLLPYVLERLDGNQTQASSLLGIGRGTLRQKLRALGLCLDKVLVEAGADGQAIESGDRA